MGSKKNEEKEGVIGEESISIANKLWDKYKRRNRVDNEFREDKTEEEEALDTFKDELSSKLKEAGLEVKILTDDDFDRMINEHDGSTIEVPELNTTVTDQAEIAMILSAFDIDIDVKEVESINLVNKITIKKKQLK
jgi:hypothetical protein